MALNNQILLLPYYKIWFVEKQNDKISTRRKIYVRARLFELLNIDNWNFGEALSCFSLGSKNCLN